MATTMHEEMNASPMSTQHVVVKLEHSKKGLTFTLSRLAGLIPVASVLANCQEINSEAALASLLEEAALYIREHEAYRNGPCNGDPFEKIPVTILNSGRSTEQELAEGVKKVVAATK